MAVVREKSEAVGGRVADNSPHDHPDYGVVSAIGMFQQQPFRDSAKSTAVIDLPPFQS
jgi:hypothetical protein